MDDPILTLFPHTRRQPSPAILIADRDNPIGQQSGLSFKKLVESPNWGELAGVKTPAMDRMNDVGHPRGSRREPAQDARLGTVGMDQIHLFIPQNAPEGAIGFPVPGGGKGMLQFGQKIHLHARELAGFLIEEPTHSRQE